MYKPENNGNTIIRKTFDIQIICAFDKIITYLIQINKDLYIQRHKKFYTLMAVFFVIVGAQISFKEAPKALWRGGVLTLTKFATGVLLGLFVAKFMGDNLLGISSLAIIAAVRLCS